jgi:hypothetical protein
MATCTAQILIGEEHQNHGGLLPDSIQQMFLTENSIPKWTLHDTRSHKAIATWVPEKPETILEDAFLAVAYWVVREEWVVSLIGKQLAHADLAVVNLGEAFSPDALEKMRATCRKSSFEGEHRTKLIIVAFDGSSVIQQLPVVAQYGFDCEVIAPTFYRSYSQWQKQVIVRGSL